MVKIFHFDHNAKHFNEYQPELEVMLKDNKVDYECIKPKAAINPFEYYREEIEEKLPKKDIFLAHIGSDWYGYVLTEYPTKFPDLKVFFIAVEPEVYCLHYQKSESMGELISVNLGYISDVFDFILQTSKK